MSAFRKFLSTNRLKNGLSALGSSSFTRSASGSASQFVLHSDIPDVDIPETSVDEFLFSNVHKWPNHIATECGWTGRNYTYGQIQTNCRNFSRSLRKKLKLQRGEVVALLLPNCPEFGIAAIGALKAGLIVTTINPIYTPEEISRQLNDSATKAIITLVDLHQLAKSAANLSKTQIPIITLKIKNEQSTPEGAVNFQELIEKIDYDDLPPSKPSDIAFLPYSSGTTGLPKGVQLTHKNIVSNLCQFDTKLVHVTTSDHQDTIPSVLPQFHIYGLVGNALLFLHKGSKSITLPRFTPETYLETLRKHKPDVLFVAPPLILFLAGHQAVKTEDLQSIRTVICGAAPLGATDEKRFLEKAQKPINMTQGYGLTETSPLICQTRIGSKNWQGSIGTPASRTLCKIINPEDPKATPLGPNEVGELVVKGPQVMKGYHNKPKETRETFTEDGWLRTGDLAYYNDDRILFIADRLKELIKVKGFQVPPAELEEVVRDFPDVEDAAVIGIPHSTHGEVPRAFVVPKNGKTVDVDKLVDFVASKVARYKQLKGGVEIIESIPKNASGKILRRVIKEQYLSRK